MNEEQAALSNNIPKEIATLHKFLKEGAGAKNEAQKAQFVWLDTLIEKHVVAKKKSREPYQR